MTPKFIAQTRLAGRRFVQLATLCGLVPIIAACGGGGGGGGGVGGPGPTPVAPTFTAQPVAITVADGATANFSVTASGDAPLAYQWRRNGVDLVNGAGVIGATTATLALTSPYPFNASQLSVRVTNLGGSVTSNNALLTVTAIAPLITKQPLNVSAIAGEPATFTVNISGGTAPVTYQWKRNGVAIPGATATSYTISTTVVGDNGASFVLEITNPAGTLSSSAAALSVVAVGRSWGAAKQINSGDANSDPNAAQVVIDPSGNAIAVWQEVFSPGRTRNAVYANRYVAGGTWGTAETIDFGVGNGIAPQISMNANGVAVAAFSQSTDNNGGVLDMITNRFDGAWGSPIRIEALNTVNAQNPDVTLANDGKATVVFSQSDGTGARVWVNSSASPIAWGTPLIVDNLSGVEPQVATSANGHSVMTWSEHVGGTPNGRAVFARRNIGAGWLPAEKISDELGALESPLRVQMDANGNAIVVWSQEFGNARNYVYAARLAALPGTWTTSILSDITHDALSPRVAVNAGGNAVVVWYEADRRGASQAEYGIRSNRYNATASTWSGPIAIQSSAGGVDPSIGIDSGGNVIAVWVQPIATRPTRAELWAANLNNTAGAAWGTPAKLMTDPDAYTLKGYEPKIAMNANGEAVVVWYQRSDAPAAGIWARLYR